MRAAAESVGLDVGRVLALDDGEPGELLALSIEVLTAYACALVETDERRAGRVPAGWTVAAECSGCGPVWLGAGSPVAVVACPWCWNRREGGPVPLRVLSR